jgi:hypothetical protein
MSASGGIFVFKGQKKGAQKGKVVPIKREVIENSFVSNAKNEIISGK